jgi:Arc/MetJ family transcription regulator
MRTTLALDDDLLRKAQEFTGMDEKTALVREALKALIERESAHRLASLGGTMPLLKNVPRQRSSSPDKASRRNSARSNSAHSNAARSGESR